jgi:hypothetical protein
MIIHYCHNNSHSDPHPVIIIILISVGIFICKHYQLEGIFKQATTPLYLSQTWPCCCYLRVRGDIMRGLKKRTVAPREGGTEVGPLLGEGGGALGPQRAVVRLTVAKVRPDTWTVKENM